MSETIPTAATHPEAATDPDALHRLFAARLNSADLDGLVALYEEGATLVGPDGVQSSGSAALRERLQMLLSMRPALDPIDSRALVVGDLALMSNRWRMTFGPDAQSCAGVEASSTEVARRQPGGEWRYVIDDPTSTAVSAVASVRAIERAPDPVRAADAPRRFEQLIYAEDGPVARITLNRPQQRNALSMVLSDELTAALEQVSRSRELKVLVIDGAGDSFCAGDDITEMRFWGDANQVMQRVRTYQRMADTLADLDKVTIAAVDGYAVGGGLEITMACDFVIATARARWGMPEVDVGITPGWGGTTRMARLIGRRMAKEINLLGALHFARRAVELGLWNRVVAHEALAEEVDALVQVLLSKNQQALRQLKFIIDHGVEADLHTAQGFEALSAGLTGAVNGAWQVDDADQAQGILSFVAKSETWRRRRALARDFWTGGPDAPCAGPGAERSA